MIVERGVPPELLYRLNQKELFFSGGTIRVASGYKNAGSIVKHLRFPENKEQTSEILKGLSSTLKNHGSTLQSIQSLQNATLILQGMNLAISVAGFALVLGRLNKIDKEIKNIDSKLENLQLAVDEIKEYQETIQYSRYFANLESLHAGLRLKKEHMVDSSILKVRDSQYLFQNLCSKQLQDIKSLYKNSKLFHMHLQIVIGGVICISNAHAQQGEYTEADRVLSDFSEWYLEIGKAILSPIENKVKPAWLAKLTQPELEEMKKTVDLTRSLPENIKYLNDNINLLSLSGRSINAIKDKGQLLVISC